MNLIEFFQGLAKRWEQPVKPYEFDEEKDYPLEGDGRFKATWRINEKFSDDYPGKRDVNDFSLRKPTEKLGRLMDGRRSDLEVENERLKLELDMLKRQIADTQPVKDVERVEMQNEITEWRKKNQKFKGTVIRYLEKTFGQLEADGKRSLEAEDLSTDEVVLLQSLEIEL